MDLQNLSDDNYLMDWFTGIAEITVGQLAGHKRSMREYLLTAIGTLWLGESF